MINKLQFHVLCLFVYFRHSQRENEVRKIAAVSQDGLTLTLNEPLEHTHLGVSVTLPDGTVFEARAEVGLLTRNIVVRGSQHQEWNDQIEACPDGFNTGAAFKQLRDIVHVAGVVVKIHTLHQYDFIRILLFFNDL